MMRLMRALWILVIASLLTLARGAVAQACPQSLEEAKASSTLHGTLIYHNELRQWLGLKLDKETCGEEEIELVFLEAGNWRQAEALRNCQVTVIGILYYGLTGYYSAGMAISDPMVAPDVSCNPFPVKPDLATMPKKANIKRFTAQIVVDYKGAGSVKVRVWEDEQKKAELAPWEPYLSYMITGGRDVIWFHCADSFEISHIEQAPKPKDGWFQDDPNMAGTVLPGEVNTITFTCEREAKHSSDQ